MKNSFIYLILMALFGGGYVMIHTTTAHAQGSKTESIVLGGGCFWGVEAVFDHVKGVDAAVSGYAGGSQETAHYEKVSQGDTGHAESVRVTYNPDEISLDTLLDIYFTVAHDPTQLNYQGPDQGTQYRSVIFYANEEQRKAATQKIEALRKTKAFPSPIVTVLEPLSGFYPAEGEHQRFAERHPTNLYILINDAPKVKNLKRLFPQLYRE